MSLYSEPSNASKICEKESSGRMVLENWAPDHNGVHMHICSMWMQHNNMGPSDAGNYEKYILQKCGKDRPLDTSSVNV